MEVFMVQHAYEVDGEEDVKTVGIYSTRTEAEAAVERARARPGFRDYPDGFYIDRYVLDRDCWTEGFVSVED